MAKSLQANTSPFQYLPGWFWRTSLAILGGLAAGPSLPQVDFWPLIFVSVIAIHLAIRGVGWLGGLGVGFAAGVAFYASQSVWMSAYLGPEPWLALAVLEGLIFAFGIALSAATWNWLRGKNQILGGWQSPAIILLLALIWVAREWVACHFPYGGYQWSRLGQSLAGTSLSSLAYWGGTSLVSFAVAIIGLTVVVLVQSQPPRHPVRAAAIVAAPAVLLILLAVFTVLPSARIPAEQKGINVTAIQGNANAGLFANPVAGSILQKHLRATQLWLNRNPDALKSTKLVVWPENASDIDPIANPFAGAQLHNFVDNVLRRPLLLGAVTWRGKDVYNSALLFRPNKVTVEVYDKRRPVPFAEYVPDRPFWNALAPNLIGLIYRGFTPGNRPGIFAVAGTKIGTLICFEIGIDEIPHDLVMSGATVIMSQANNADFGHTAEAFQQESLVRLEAIATGRYIVHASTVATTEIIAPDGSVLTATKPFTPAWASAVVGEMHGITPAMAWFGWVDKISVFFAGLALLRSMFAGAIILSKRLGFIKSTPSENS